MLLRNAKLPDCYGLPWSARPGFRDQTSFKETMVEELLMSWSCKSTELLQASPYHKTSILIQSLKESSTQPNQFLESHCCSPFMMVQINGLSLAHLRCLPFRPVLILGQTGTTRMIGSVEFCAQQMPPMNKVSIQSFRESSVIADFHPCKVGSSITCTPLLHRKRDS